ncbi:MAG: ATP-binding protein [Pseudomonadota bacterium]|nr:ATP-binding protein [Pseudomonadota bacterium]MDQ2765364.1 ATP-binding protein [Pseudomonadota bacterium]
MTLGAPHVVPADESQRMAAVTRYDILDTPPDGSFDRITALAARRFKVPISIISIVDHDRIWFKSHHGVPMNQIGRDPGLCASAILTPDPHILVDATADPRSLANPLVAGEFGLGFYAGVPLRTNDGYNLGTLCIIDKTPRPIDQTQIDDLKDLASVVMDQMELRLSARQAVFKAEIMAREIEHRVMNSLQFISGLLMMQSRVPDLTDTAGQLQMAANRVAAVARVHRHFYSNEAAEMMSCLTFLRRLCGDLSGILGKSIEVIGDEVDVPTTRIQPIGLIVNELVTNAAKHATGKIKVTYGVRGDGHELSVSDEGDGLPPGFDPDKRGEGLGMKVVGTLARQLGGRMIAGANPTGRGSCLTVVFPA